MAASPQALPPQKQHLENILPEKYLHGFGALRWIPYVFIDIVNKVNRKGTVQQRVLIVTDTHVYSCLPNDGDVQRCFPISEITEIFIYQRGNEIGIQCPADYDYLCQLRTAGSLQQFLSVMEGRKQTQCNTPVQQSHNLSIEKPSQYTKVTPAPLTISYNRCHRNLARNLSMANKQQQQQPQPQQPSKGASFASPGGKQEGAAAQPQRQLRYDESVHMIAASPEDANRFDEEMNAKERGAWQEVTTTQGSSSVVQKTDRSLAPSSSQQQQQGSSRPSSSSGQQQSNTRHVDAMQGSPENLHRNQPNKELMTPLRDDSVPSPRGLPVTPRVRADGTVLSTEELLQFERNRNINYRRMMAELIAAEREASSVLRQVIDDLRAEVDRLSVENMKLKHPSLDF